MKTFFPKARLGWLVVLVLTLGTPWAHAQLFGPPVASRGGVRWQVGVSVGAGSVHGGYGSARGYGPYRGGYGPGPRFGHDSYWASGWGPYGAFSARNRAGRGYYYRDPFLFAGSWGRDSFYASSFGYYGGGFGYGYGSGWAPRVVRTPVFVTAPGARVERRRLVDARERVTRVTDDLRDARSPEQLRAIYGDQAARLAR